MTPRIRYLLAATALAAAPGLARAEFLYGLTANNSLVLFDSATPGTVSGPIAVTGLQAGDSLLAIDFRPANMTLYALGQSAGGVNTLYAINQYTGAVTQTIALTGTTNLGGTFYGFDFNPVADRLRVVTDAGKNYNINPNTGAVTTQTALAYVAGDINTGATPFVVAAAYTNNFAGATSTTLYAIDANGGYLATIIPPGSGQLDTVGTPGSELPLGPPTTADASFDISGRTGVAFALLNGSTLSTINLGTAEATVVGDVGGPGFLVDFSVAAVPAPPAAVLLGIGAVGLAGFRRLRRS